MTCALQPWVMSLSIMQQSVIMGAVRGPDGVGKYHPSKFLIRWYRRCILMSAFDGKALTTPYAFGGGSFTGPSYEPTVFEHDWEPRMDAVVSQYLQSLDELPHHYQMHFLHAVEIVGYKHPDPGIRRWWCRVYYDLVNDLHLSVETEAEMDERLSDDERAWAERSHEATSL